MDMQNSFKKLMASASAGLLLTAMSVSTAAAGSYDNDDDCPRHENRHHEVSFKADNDVGSAFAFDFASRFMKGGFSHDFGYKNYGDSDWDDEDSDWDDENDGYGMNGHNDWNDNNWDDDTDQDADVDADSSTNVESNINAHSYNDVFIGQYGDDDSDQDANVNANSNTSVTSTINATSGNYVNIHQN